MSSLKHPFRSKNRRSSLPTSNRSTFCGLSAQTTQSFLSCVCARASTSSKNSSTGTLDNLKDNNRDLNNNNTSNTNNVIQEEKILNENNHNFSQRIELSNNHQPYRVEVVDTEPLITGAGQVTDTLGESQTQMNRNANCSKESSRAGSKTGSRTGSRRNSGYDPGMVSQYLQQIKRRRSLDSSTLIDIDGQLKLLQSRSTSNNNIDGKTRVSQRKYSLVEPFGSVTYSQLSKLRTEITKNFQPVPEKSPNNQNPPTVILTSNNEKTNKAVAGVTCSDKNLIVDENNNMVDGIGGQEHEKTKREIGNATGQTNNTNRMNQANSIQNVKINSENQNPNQQLSSNVALSEVEEITLNETTMTKEQALIENIRDRVQICDSLTVHTRNINQIPCLSEYVQHRRRSISTPAERQVPGNLIDDYNQSQSIFNEDDNSEKQTRNVSRSQSLSYKLHTFNPGHEWPYDDNLKAFLSTDKRKNNPLTSVFLGILNNTYKNSNIESNPPAHQTQTTLTPNDKQSNNSNNSRNRSPSPNNTLRSSSSQNNILVLVDTLLSSVHDPCNNINRKKIEKLEKFLNKIEKSYQKVPYHNVNHAVDVLTAVEVLMNQVEYSKIAKFTLFERVTCLLAAACHDVGHPGVTAEHIMKNYGVDGKNMTLTEMFQNSGEEDAGGKSKGMLERYHSSVALCLMRELDMELAFHDEFCELFNSCIMATDMTRHADIVNQLKDIASQNYANNDLKNLSELQRHKLLPIILHIADLSNPAKKFTDASLWADKVCMEFFQQGDIERVLNDGKIGMILHDREKTTVYGCQVGFINFMTLPLVKAWSNLLIENKDAKEIELLMESNRDIYKEKNSM